MRLGKPSFWLHLSKYGIATRTVLFWQVTGRVSLGLQAGFQQKENNLGVLGKKKHAFTMTLRSSNAVPFSSKWFSWDAPKIPAAFYGIIFLKFLAKYLSQFKNKQLIKTELLFGSCVIKHPPPCTRNGGRAEVSRKKSYHRRATSNYSANTINYCICGN